MVSIEIKTESANEKQSIPGVSKNVYKVNRA